MSFFNRVRHIIADNQILLVLLALLLGLTFPKFFLPLAAYSTPLLMMIFFTSSLRLRLHDIFIYVHDWKMLILANLTMLFVMPILLWIPSTLFAPDWALAFLIVGAMPTGITVALIADLFGGSMSLAMLISATTSLLAPFTIPIVFALILGQKIPIDTMSLFTSLCVSIILPFFLAMLFKISARKQIEQSDLVWREISLTLFALLIAGIVADTVQESTFSLGFNEIGIVTSMLICMGGIAWASYALSSWRKPSERVTIALCMVYMNNTLALYIGNTFFHDQKVVPQLIFILTAVNALLIPVKWLASRIIKQSKKDTSTRVAQPLI
jgi:predicted Na+-dependent transporter